jgi:hypothetical protein
MAIEYYRDIPGFFLPSFPTGIAKLYPVAESTYAHRISLIRICASKLASVLIYRP